MRIGLGVVAFHAACAAACAHHPTTGEQSWRAPPASVQCATTSDSVVMSGWFRRGGTISATPSLTFARALAIVGAESWPYETRIIRCGRPFHLRLPEDASFVLRGGDLVESPCPDSVF